MQIWYNFHHYNNLFQILLTRVLFICEYFFYTKFHQSLKKNIQTTSVCFLVNTIFPVKKRSPVFWISHLSLILLIFCFLANWGLTRVKKLNNEVQLCTMSYEMVHALGKPVSWKKILLNKDWNIHQIQQNTTRVTPSSLETQSKPAFPPSLAMYDKINHVNWDVKTKILTEEIYANGHDIFNTKLG